ncbi:MAG: malto-oligosyltrehalose synthase [Microbacteriaceae bacterium]|nr:malto-oligosyltrehalose synthase [Microbacteriaceae bacterium]
MRTPRSTYRLQLTPEFTFDDARAQLPYLAKLGVDWVYLSPILQSTTGSQHGYDVVDATRVDEARGGREGFERFARAAHDAGLGVLVDIVPNHMGIAVPRENPWWWDVLAHGREAEHADFFDIDWDAADGRVLVPVVGDDDMPQAPGDPIAHLEVDRDAGVLRYWDLELPLAPGSADDGADAREVHRRQHYRLVHWRVGDWALNYRRFFTITTLAGLRVEDERVFDAAHAEILRWVREGLVDGLRIDHPDGLRDPAGYLRRLREATGGVYVSVEKILEPGEELPDDWACEGTTGYDALGEFERVMIAPDGLDDLGAFAASLSTRDTDDWPTLVHAMKREVTDEPLQAELARVARELAADGIEGDGVVDALAEIAASMPVYRTYLPHGEEIVRRAAVDAADWRPDLRGELERLVPVLTDPRRAAALRWQQTTGMVMAKAVEDRAFYRWSRLTSLNEVGGDPASGALAPDAFHEAQRRRHERRPLAQTALTTHDTKRSEDTRARIDVLAEIADEWADALDELLDIAPLPNRGFANLVWQAVIGAWPASRERLHAYVEKAAREAGDITTWTAIDAEYEAALHRAVDAAFDHPAARAIVARLNERVTPAGDSNSLVLKAMQLLAPGVPDVYQGTELWDRSLVDPDNRRRVDWFARAAALDAVTKGARPEIDETGAAKLMVVTAALRLRRRAPERFDEYTPLEVTGPAAEHAIAFDRGGVVLVGTRLPIGLAEGGGWFDTRVHLPEGEWVDQLSGREAHGAASVAALLAELPLSILARR